MSETFFVNVSAPGWVIGWIRRWIAGSSGMEGTMVGTAEDPAGRRDVGCCECLLGPLWAGSSRSSFIICQGNFKKVVEWMLTFRRAIVRFGLGKRVTQSFT